MKTQPLGPFLRFVFFVLVSYSRKLFCIKQSDVCCNPGSCDLRAPFVCGFRTPFKTNAGYSRNAFIGPLRSIYWLFYSPTACAKRMKGVFCANVRLMRVFCRIKVPKKNFSSIYGYARAILIFVFSPVCSKKPGLVIRVRDLLVALVFGNRCFSEVFNPVVRWNAVDVIDKPFRPNAMNVEPSKPMGLESSVPNSDVPAPFVPARSGNVPGFCASATNSPYKLSGMRAVIEKLAQSFCGQFIFYNAFSHDDSYKVRLVRACVAVQTPHRLVHFTGAIA